MLIFENETIDDLQLGGLKIIQKKDGFKFGTDAVLLSDFAKDVKSEKTLDMCSGSGIVPILLSAKTKTAKIFCLEIQEIMCDTAKRSMELNNLSGRIEVVCGDVKDGVKIFGKRQFDLITCNPPYMKINSAIPNENNLKLIARHEILCNLEDVIAVSSSLIKTSGHLVLVHQPRRLCEITGLMQKYNIAPKRIRFVMKKAKDAPELVLIDGMFGAKSDVKILPSLILYDDNNEPTEELNRIYGRN